MRNLLATILFLTLGSLAFAQRGGAPKFNRVIVVVLENTNYSVAALQPFLGQLAKNGAILTNFFAETHPSQGNYIAMTAGDSYGITTDVNVNLNSTHIGDLLEAKGRTWKAYADGYPGNCFVGAQKGNYVRKHVPFMSYSNVQTSPKRCGLIVNSSEFAKDVQAGTLPDYSFYVPDLRNDGHNTGVAFADQWLQQAFGPLVANKQLMSGTLLIVTFDESEKHSNNQIFTVLYGEGVKPGSTTNAKLNHYSLLKMIEEEWGLGNLGRQDATAAPIVGVWN